MIPVQGYANKTLAVLGLGRSGRAAAAALMAGDADVVVWDDSVPARESAQEAGLEIRDLTKAGAFDGIAKLIVSPGIPHLYPHPNAAIAAAWDAAVPVDNDIGLFFQSFATSEWDNFDVAPRIVAVTGSNGKSTTSALIHHILVENGRPAQLAGNIGRGVLDIDPAHDGEVVVLELSSYQTDLARSLTPDVAVFTNLSPDHLDRHAGLGGYFAAKRRLFAEGGPDRAIIGVDEPEGRYLANQLIEGAGDDRVIQISSGRKLSQGWCVFARKGFLAEMRKGRQVGAIDLRDIAGLPGAHNHQNSCAAYAVCRSLGLGPKGIEAAMRSYPGLPHRSQLVADHNGVRYVNDSKATNVDSAAKALQAFTNIRWICGGLQKEGGLGAVLPHLNNVAKAYVIGREAADFARQLEGASTQVVRTMEAAVAQAVKDAQPGDVVLLAPAAASFDQYDSFEKRGDDFIACVNAAIT
ncbi:UDP-N-acetylmuramoyl-L-alanine--D-glutamate ligase [Loktanella sp. D2R18]|uniref:UDP-N-acetylmuramoyl-L-alanine--D-glutamate ligase n=1 Tax=Rhodobacterales TaxID=204455 RepID=UPI000DE9EE1E|nr:MULTISPECIES: UDP-N-acetylmuramoyl-L-alanine--D-glutamate ligase [Rhodobacterales]MDO6589094.1 UDP-N-acetylmuramoyl-L-alanine--D-glutamate ligase [Yoonia sp. 1_MG-2023]RBW45468.1 UDP-N-acetylmuramoyl-L-alanine--D-glutamate ligase [Loktanella sp. D2R18]